MWPSASQSNLSYKTLSYLSACKNQDIWNCKCVPQKMWRDRWADVMTTGQELQLRLEKYSFNSIYRGLAGWQ